MTFMPVKTATARLPIPFEQPIFDSKKKDTRNQELYSPTFF